MYLPVVQNTCSSAAHRLSQPCPSVLSCFGRFCGLPLVFNAQIPPSPVRVLYSGTMNRMLIIAVVACVILFVVAVLIAPTLDLQPSALRAQQWLSLIAALFSVAGLFEICFQILMVPTTIGPPLSVSEPRQQVSLLDQSCFLLC